MAYRVTLLESENGVTLRVEGCLDAEAVNDLLRQIRIGEPRFRVDLSGLLSTDDCGVRVLKKLAAGGVELLDASPFIRQLIGNENTER